MQKQKTALVWFTNNLRVHDNKALKDASQYDRVIGLYCFDQTLFESTQFGLKKIEKYRAKFLMETVKNLKSNLNTLNIPLFILYGRPSYLVNEFCLTHNVDALFFQKEYTFEEVKIIDEIKSSLPSNVKINEYNQQFLLDPDDIPFETDSLPEIFTVFRRSIEAKCEVKLLNEIPSMPESNLMADKCDVEQIEDLGFKAFNIPYHSAFQFKGGETSGINRLIDYFYKTKSLQVYKYTRNGFIGDNYSSKFSPWLANGSLSARKIYWEVKKFESEYGANESTYWLIFELYWRDYFKHLAIKHQNDLFKIGGFKHKKYDWKQDPVLIDQWINGKTADPFVNANMVELHQTGWMSNRGRQNVASYFAKDLKLDWRIGASYFESLLIDYDVHSNYGNWQYVSGVGNDPRDRKFNVKLQAERYDKNGKFQKLWLQPSLF
ncbi:DASH family cryptochrome [Aureibacter tunicatorum]|uniref:Cryptochrome DASH n=1 Tax=Aureibacter tunicatorum TaxID=866807 RepID=A0AAE3XKT6_9BACT|nr:DASH family cryptochrome [Aureibacter tunicatorum]MDR6237833.1 deoxyribodipyrimidine photo-lyase [Aureibacter tunicatorum]BDD02869.1 deoxyribodipyrimidine photo-lyase [Aureibacter tunicatorum]